MSDEHKAVPEMNTPEPTLEEQLHKVVSTWLARVAPKLRDESFDYASIKIRLTFPQGDDDGKLYLDYAVEEKSHFSSEADNAGGGSVPSVDFK